MMCKKPPIIITILLLIISCEPSDMELAIKQKADSLRIARQDSIRIEQEKVIGEIKFGMNKKTTENLWKRFCEEHKKSEDFGTGIHNQYFIYEIGDYKFWPSLIPEPRYLNDSLYFFTINGHSSNIDFVMDMLTKKFGSPEFMPDELRRYSSTLMYWTIGEKKVEIVLTKNADIDIVIYKPKMVEKQRLLEKQISNQKAEIAKDVF